MRRGAFEVDGVAGPRFELALERLRSGHTFDFQEARFRFDGDGTLVCEVCSSWGREYVTSATASADLERGRAALRNLLGASESFSTSVRNRPIRYELIEDYGNGSILIGCERGETFTWASGIPTDAG